MVLEMRREIPDRRHVVIKSGSRIIVVQNSLIEGLRPRYGAWAQIHLIRQTMSMMEAGPTNAVCAHSSLGCQSWLHLSFAPCGEGGYCVFLQDRTQLTRSRNYRSGLRDSRGARDRFH